MRPEPTVAVTTTIVQAQASGDIWQNALFLTILGIIVTIIIGVIPLWWTLRDRKRTVISWELVSSTALDRPFRALPGGMVGTIEIILDGNAVTDVHLVVLKIENVGDYEIRAEDYTAPIAIKIREKNSQDATILKAITSDANAYGLNPLIDHYEGNSAVIRNTALNKKDSFYVQMLVQQVVQEITPNQIEINGRYIGHNAKPIESYRERLLRRVRLKRLRYSVGIIAMIISIVLLVYYAAYQAADIILGIAAVLFQILAVILIVVMDFSDPATPLGVSRDENLE